MKKTFSYSSESMQRQLDNAKAYLRARGKYVLDQGNTWTFSHEVRWEEYKRLVKDLAAQALWATAHKAS